jgi:hypothetical protein
MSVERILDEQRDGSVVEYQFDMPVKLGAGTYKFEVVSGANDDGVVRITSLDTGDFVDAPVHAVERISGTPSSDDSHTGSDEGLTRRPAERPLETHRSLALYRDGGKVHVMRQNYVGVTLCGLWLERGDASSEVVHASLADWVLDRPCERCLAVVEHRVAQRTVEQETLT